METGEIAAGTEFRAGLLSEHLFNFLISPRNIHTANKYQKITRLHPFNAPPDHFPPSLQFCQKSHFGTQVPFMLFPFKNKIKSGT